MTIPNQPCSSPDHEHQGFSYVVAPKTTEPDERVLFYGCTGCSDDRFKQAFPDCPDNHRPYRSWANNEKACNACNIGAKV